MSSFYHQIFGGAMRFSTEEFRMTKATQFSIEFFLLGFLSSTLPASEAIKQRMCDMETHA